MDGSDIGSKEQTARLQKPSQDVHFSNLSRQECMARIIFGFAFVVLKSSFWSGSSWLVQHLDDLSIHSKLVVKTDASQRHCKKDSKALHLEGSLSWSADPLRLCFQPASSFFSVPPDRSQTSSFRSLPLFFSVPQICFLHQKLPNPPHHTLYVTDWSHLSLLRFFLTKRGPDS